MSDLQPHGRTANTRYQPLHSDVELSNLNSTTEYVHDYEVEQKPLPKAPLWCNLRHRDLRDGWRFGASLGCLTCLLVLLLNIVLTIWGALRSKANNGHIFQGSCAVARHYNMGLHVVINVLSTLMLGASNYSMQCLSAPTRLNIDKAHREGKWLDIGVQSFKNLGQTQRWKWVVWGMLGLSSLPLHLLYNSMFYHTIINNDYELYWASEDWLDGGWYDSWNLPAGDTYRVQWNPLFEETMNMSVTNYDSDPGALLSAYQDDRSQFEALDPDDCIDTYARTYLSDRRNVVLISSHFVNASNFNADYRETMANVSRNSSLHAISTSSDQYELYNKYNRYGWLCDYRGRTEWDENGGCTAGKAKQEAANGNWTIYGWTVSGCVSEKLEEKCSVNFSLGIGIAVILANLGKTLCIAAVCLLLTDQPLLTVGDAVTSFFCRPDRAALACCLLDRDEISTHWRLYHKTGTSPPPKAYLTALRRRWHAPGWKSWSGFLLLFCTCLLIVMALLFYAIGKMRKWQEGSFSSLAALGFGAATSATVIEWGIPVSGNGALIRNVLVANIPQLILSGIYLTLNNLFTRMQLAVEWASYSVERKALRVSHERTGAQRSTYFLQLPYRLGLPLMIISATLHWLVSQSIFLVSINTFDARGLPKNDVYGDESEIATCGFSPLAIICTLVVGAVTILLVLIMGAQKLPASGIPLVGSNSLGIAAACHPPKDGSNGQQPLMWGVVGLVLHDEGTDVLVGHCSLSSCAVSIPAKGRLYA